jgi:hypothetical protein
MPLGWGRGLNTGAWRAGCDVRGVAACTLDPILEIGAEWLGGAPEM